MPAQAFSVDTRHDGDVLRVQVDGRIDTLEELIALFHRIEEEALASKARRLLVSDHTQGAVPDEVGMRKLVATLGDSPLTALRLAYVDARGTAIGRMELGEIVAREHGYDCRVFGDEQAARIWLRHGEA